MQKAQKEKEATVLEQKRPEVPLVAIPKDLALRLEKTLTHLQDLYMPNTE